MKNKIYFFGIALIIIIAIIFVSTGMNGAKLTSNVTNSNEFQIVKLSVTNGEYVLSPSEFEKGIPVRLEADMANMPGCSKSIVISAFNVRKTFTNTDNTIEFTPDKAGNFSIVCSMNMYRGTFTVLETDGTKSNYVDKTTSISSTCSMSSVSSCGCGG